MGNIADILSNIRAGWKEVWPATRKTAAPAVHDGGATLHPTDAWARSVAVKPLPTFPGFKAGDALSIDGPLWADGTGKVVRMDGKVLEMQFTIKDPTDLPGVRDLVKHPFIRKNGKLSLSLKVEQLDNGKVRADLVDLHDGRGTCGNGCDATIREQEKKGWFGSTKKQYVITTPEQNITITVEGSGRLNVAMSRIPVGSFDVTR